MLLLLVCAEKCEPDAARHSQAIVDDDSDLEATSSVPMMGYVLSAFMVDNLIKNLRVCLELSQFWRI